MTGLARRLTSLPWSAPLAALAGGLVYGLHALAIARTKTSFLDEGQYLYKGLLFADGVYRPYQDYGVWTNHMPFVFLIHGYIQKWFGPGLATGRYFMVLLGLLTCLGLWTVARRWGGGWWAAAIVWAMALNPAEIKIHTLAISEGLIAPMLAWMLVLVLGVRRPAWQIMLASALAAFMLMTRVNLAYIPPILILFILWRYGWKMAVAAGLVGLLVLAGLHALFWPDILKAWAWWLPESLTPFLNAWRIPPAAFGQLLPPDETATRSTIVLYTLLTFRLHFVALVSALAVGLTWPSRPGRPLTERMRAAVFLLVLLAVLLVAHMQAAYTSNCVSCILLYVGNFDFIGLILLVVAFPFLARRLPSWRRGLVFALGSLLILGVGMTAYEEVSTDFAKSWIDRMDRFYPWNALQSLTGIPPLLLFRQSYVAMLSLLAIAGLGLSLWLYVRGARDRQAALRQTGFAALNLTLAIALLLTPTRALGRGNDFFDCGGTDVLASFEEAGDYLAGVIPAGSKIYWEGRLPAIFLYLPGVTVYPPQLNHVHGYYVGGDAETLYRFSRWNDALARRWIGEADYVLLQKGFVQDWELQTVQSGGYVQLDSTRKLEKCEWQSVIDVYQRLKP
jgi:hypothetical protein